MPRPNMPAPNMPTKDAADDGGRLSAAEVAQLTRCYLTQLEAQGLALPAAATAPGVVSMRLVGREMGVGGHIARRYPCRRLIAQAQRRLGLTVRRP